MYSEVTAQAGTAQRLPGAVERAAQGSAYGALAWLAYGAIEYLLSTVFPLLSSPRTMIAPWHWRLTILVFGCYAATGAVVSAGLAALPAGKGGSTPWGLAARGTLTVILVFVLNLVTGPRFGGSEAISCALALVLAAVGVAGMRRPAWFEKRWFPYNAWICSGLLLSPPWLNRHLLQGRPPAWKLLGTLAGVGVIIGAGVLSRMADRRKPSAARPSLGRQFCVTALVIIGMFGGAALLSRGVPAGPPAQTSAARGRPDVVLITLDTVRADHLSVYGYPRDTTPALRGLAGHATVYRRAVATADMTLPSHGSIFTGVYPRWHGAFTDHHNYRPLSKRYRTLAEILADHGYLNMAVVANSVVLQHAFGMDRGFAVFDSRTPIEFLNPDDSYYLRQLVRRVAAGFTSTSEFDLMIRRAGEITDEAAELLQDTAGKRRPVFLFLNYMDAHSPYTPPTPYRDRFPAPVHEVSYPEYRQLRIQVLSRKRRVTAAEREYLISRYDGGIAYMDAELGRLFARLKQLGIYDRSLIIVTADHGEAFGERQLLQHEVSVYQDQVHVPLIVKYPGQSMPRTVGALTSGVDLMPTVLETLGYAIPAGIQGQPLSTAEHDGSRMVISESFPSFLADWHPSFNRTETAIFQRPWKLIRSTAGKRELYDIEADPGEAANRYRQESSAATVAALNARLAAMMQSAPHAASPGSGVTRDVLERLKSLGYAQ